VEEKVFLKT